MGNRIDHNERRESLRALIAWGRSNRDIAVILGLALRTVDHYIRQYGLARLRRQLGVRSSPGRPSQPPPGRAPQRQCLGCGARVHAEKGRWLCDRCRARRASGSSGVPGHWLETPGHT